MPLKAVLFDLDGTLVDSAADLRDALNAVLAEEALAPLDLDAVKGMVGDGVTKLVQRGLRARGGDLKRLPGRVARFMALYGAAPTRLTRVYPQVPETLAWLREKNLRLAVVTNKPHAVTTTILETLGLAPLFDSVVGGDTLAQRKPDPAPLLHAMALLGASPAETLMVGDNRHDVEAAHAVRMRAAVVTYGYAHGPVAEMGAEWVIGDFREVIRIVEGPLNLPPSPPSTPAQAPACRRGSRSP